MERRPIPRGVPRWLWPPPGATVRRVAIRERVDAEGRVTHEVAEGEPPETLHVRALRWLLDEPPKGQAVPSSETEVVLEIATSRMAAGRLGYAYAVDGGPLGEPGADAARGALWRYVLLRGGGPG